MRVNGTDLWMTRGDSETVVIACAERPFTEGDTVVFTVKKDVFDEMPVLQKKITEFTEEGDAVVEVYPEDTRKMQETLYRYDVQLTTASGTVATIVRNSQFVLEREVNGD